MIQTKQAGNESKNLCSWHLSEEGVLVCTDEHGFLNLQDLHFQKVVNVVDHAIANRFASYRLRVDAVDIVLESFEAVRKRLSRHGLSLDYKKGFETYLKKAALRLLVRKAKECRDFEDHLDETVLDVPADSLSALKRERLLELRRKTVKKVFEDCFRRNWKMKEVVYRSVVKEEDHRTIAGDLGLTEAYARQLKHRGLDMLKKEFQKLTGPPWNDGFMEDLLFEKHLYFNRHIPSICETNLNSLSLNPWIHSTERMKNIEKRAVITSPSVKTPAIEPSANRRRRKSRTRSIGISEERFEALLKLLKESFHGHAGSNDRP